MNVFSIAMRSMYVSLVLTAMFRQIRSIEEAKLWLGALGESYEGSTLVTIETPWRKGVTTLYFMSFDSSLMEDAISGYRIKIRRLSTYPAKEAEYRKRLDEACDKLRRAGASCAMPLVDVM